MCSSKIIKRRVEKERAARWIPLVIAANGHCLLPSRLFELVAMCRGRCRSGYGSHTMRAHENRYENVGNGLGAETNMPHSAVTSIFAR